MGFKFILLLSNIISDHTSTLLQPLIHSIGPYRSHHLFANFYGSLSNLFSALSYHLVRILFMGLLLTLLPSEHRFIVFLPVLQTCLGHFIFLLMLYDSAFDLPYIFWKTLCLFIIMSTIVRSHFHIMNGANYCSENFFPVVLNSK